MSPERFVTTVRVVFILVLLLLSYIIWSGTVPAPGASGGYRDPADLFRTTGIRECEFDAVYKFEGAGAVTLDPEDFAIAHEFLMERFAMDASVILYTNAPVATKDMPGQPALIPLKRSGDTYCALGVVGSSSVPLFLSLQEKYQSRIE